MAAHSGQTDIRITAKANSEAEAGCLIAGAEAQVRERVGQYISASIKSRSNALLKALRSAYAVGDQRDSTGRLVCTTAERTFSGALNGQDMLHTTEQFRQRCGTVRTPCR
jgi:hypothetical protein